MGGTTGKHNEKIQKKRCEDLAGDDLQESKILPGPTETPPVPAGSYELRVLQSLRRIIRAVEIHSKKLVHSHKITGPQLGCLNTAGGFGQYIRVPAGWVVPLPDGLSLRQAMCYGTAGFTAALSVLQLVNHGVLPEHGEILVSGATGGVGGIAVPILAKQGYTVAAVNGKTDRSDYLKSIGAQHIIAIEDAVDTSGRPMLSERWAGSVDAVGGDLLATTIKSMSANGVVTTCGNVASPDLPINVYPFILRGVTLVGIDSQNCPMAIRRRAWDKLAREWQITQMETVVEEITLNELDQRINKMLTRGSKGRVIVNMQFI